MSTKHELKTGIRAEMKEIWIIGMGRFGQLAADRLAQIHHRYHLILVDPDREHLRQGTGPHRTLEPMEGISFLDQRLIRKKPRTGSYRHFRSIWPHNGVLPGWKNAV
jgi:hypothetical protein